LAVDLIDNLHFHRSSTITIIQDQNTCFNKYTINLYHRYEQSIHITKQNLYTDYKIGTKIPVLHDHHQLSTVIVGFEDISSDAFLQPPLDEWMIMSLQDQHKY
jgi:hypothetical protein